MFSNIVCVCDVHSQLVRIVICIVIQGGAVISCLHLYSLACLLCTLMFAWWRPRAASLFLYETDMQASVTKTPATLRDRSNYLLVRNVGTTIIHVSVDTYMCRIHLRTHFGCFSAWARTKIFTEPSSLFYDTNGVAWNIYEEHHYGHSSLRLWLNLKVLKVSKSALCL